MSVLDIEVRLLDLLAEVRDSIQANQRLLSASLYRIGSSRRRLNRAFGMSGSSDSDTQLSNPASTLRKSENPLLREKARQAIDRRRVPSREPDRLRGMTGVGRTCSVCESPVTTEETDIELHFENGATPEQLAVYHVHLRCYSAWVRTIREARPHALSEHQSLKAELVEIPRQISAYWDELENGSLRRTRREQLEWMIQDREKRLAEVRARLAAIKHEP